MTRASQASRIVAMLVSAAALTAATAGATPIVDQAQLLANTQLNGGLRDLIWQQGVVAGLAGQLVEVDLYANTSGTANVFVNLGAGWQSDVSEFSSNITFAVGLNAIDVRGAKIKLSPGTQYVIGIQGLNASNSGIVNPLIRFKDSTNAYSGGALWQQYRTSQPSMLTDNRNDLTFATVVDVAAPTNTDPVPEPATLLLVSGGFASLVTARRRRQGKASHARTANDRIS